MQSQAQNIIFGVDIVKGSSRSREAPRYALVILNGEIERYPSVSLFKLLRLIRQYRPDMLAVDSIQELAPNRKELIAFLKRLPPEVKLVQVTGNEHQEPLTKLGKEKGIAFNPIIPEEEAFACACLAAMSVGYVVSVFEDRTIIKVSRARSPGRGGWSQNRYRRKIQGKVREKVREIEQKLRDTDYEARLTEGFGGLVNGTFVVNRKRSELGIHNSREEDVQVSVTSVEKQKIEFIPLERKGREHIIVGVDPGTTIGIAALNLDGELVGLVSSRMMSVPDIVSYIREKGKPVVVATDVVPPPGDRGEDQAVLQGDAVRAQRAHRRGGEDQARPALRLRQRSRAGRARRGRQGLQRLQEQVRADRPQGAGPHDGRRQGHGRRGQDHRRGHRDAEAPPRAGERRRPRPRSRRRPRSRPVWRSCGSSCGGRTSRYGTCSPMSPT